MLWSVDEQDFGRSPSQEDVVHKHSGNTYAMYSTKTAERNPSKRTVDQL